MSIISKDPELMQEIVDGVHDDSFTPASTELVQYINTLEFICSRLKEALLTGNDRPLMLRDLSLIQSFAFLEAKQMEELTSLTLE